MILPALELCADPGELIDGIYSSEAARAGELPPDFWPYDLEPDKSGFRSCDFGLYYLRKASLAGLPEIPQAAQTTIICIRVFLLVASRVGNLRQLASRRALDASSAEKPVKPRVWFYTVSAFNTQD
jgi:hypothetical protein